MNLPRCLFTTAIAWGIAIGFHGSAIGLQIYSSGFSFFKGDGRAIASWGNAVRDDLVAQTPNCDNPQTQTQMNICAAIYYETADKKLNEVYQELSGQMRSQLTDPQLAWIEFRDTNCEFARNLFEGGSIAPTIQNECLGGMTQQRTFELEVYQAGEIPQPSSRNYSRADQKLNEFTNSI